MVFCVRRWQKQGQPNLVKPVIQKGQLYDSNKLADL